MSPDGVVLDIHVAVFASAVDSLLTVGGSHSPTLLYPRSCPLSLCFGMGQTAIAMDTEGRVSSFTAAFFCLFPLVFLPLRRRSFESLFFVLQPCLDAQPSSIMVAIQNIVNGIRSPTPPSTLGENITQITTIVALPSARTTSPLIPRNEAGNI